MFRRNSFLRQLCYTLLRFFPPSRRCLRSRQRLFLILRDQFWTSHSSFQTYIPLSSALGNNFQTSLAFYNHSLFYQFPLIPFFEKKKERKKGRKEELANLVLQLALLVHLKNYGTLR